MSSMFGPNKYARGAQDDTDWIDLTLLNGWVYYGTPYSTARYRRLGGLVYVRGLIKSGTVTDGTIIANLPAGFRPAVRLIMPAMVTSPGTTTGRLDVDSNGNIIGAMGLVASWTSINFPPFIAEQ